MRTFIKAVFCTIGRAALRKTARSPGEVLSFFGVSLVNYSDCLLNLCAISAIIGRLNNFSPILIGVSIEVQFHLLVVPTNRLTRENQ